VGDCAQKKARGGAALDNKATLSDLIAMHPGHALLPANALRRTAWRATAVAGHEESFGCSFTRTFGRPVYNPKPPLEGNYALRLMYQATRGILWAAS
jgi:hypothetical protein